jgi:hypothetical protein
LKDTYDSIKSGVKNVWNRVVGGKEEKKPVVDDIAERKKLERQQKEAVDTERVRKQEEKAKYYTRG